MWTMSPVQNARAARLLSAARHRFSHSLCLVFSVRRMSGRSGGRSTQADLEARGGEGSGGGVGAGPMPSMWVG